MTVQRSYIPYPERLAATLACLLSQEHRDDLRRRKVAADEVIGLFDFDHIALFSFETPDRDKWHNLDPMLREPHRLKTRNDLKIIAKVRRIRATVQPQTTPEGLAAVIVYSQKKWPKRKIPQRKNPWPKGRKIRSRQ
jgi:hypothetical protein